MSDVQAGRHIWYDLMSSDPEGAKRFYGEVVGWTVTPFEGGAEPYEMWTADHGPVGGVLQLPPEVEAQGVPSYWLAYIATPDLDATVDRAKQLGGTMHHQESVPTVGRFAFMQDPWGAPFCPFTPDEMPPEGGRPGPGAFTWHELMTEDHEKAFAFYSELFGWEKGVAMDMGEAGIYQLFRRPGKDLDDGGMMNRPPEVPVSSWLYYVNTADLDAAVATVKAEGGQVLHGPMEVPGGDRVCVCMDPQGGAFALHEYGS